jgi:RND family efflux transporter MFP subunit
MKPKRSTAPLLAALLFLAGPAPAQEAVQVRVKQVREATVQRTLPLSGRVFSRNDAALSLTLSGELDWVLEPGTLVNEDDVIAQLDQQPILLRKSELEHQAEQERVNASYLEKELRRLHKLRKDNNASERLVDEGASALDISRMQIKSLESRLDQVDDELRRSRVVAPFGGMITLREKRGGEYVSSGDLIVRLVDIETLELRVQVPVAYLGRVRPGAKIAFGPQGRQLSGEQPADYTARVRAVIAAADPSSQTFEIRADVARSSSVVAGQLVNVAIPMSSAMATVQIPRDAIVLRSEGNFVYRISSEDIAEKVMVEVGEGNREWVSISGDLKGGDWVAVRGVERLRDGQKVSREDPPRLQAGTAQ